MVSCPGLSGLAASILLGLLRIFQGSTNLQGFLCPINMKVCLGPSLFSKSRDTVLHSCDLSAYHYLGFPSALCHCLPCRKVSGSSHTTSMLTPPSNLHFTCPNSALKSFSKPHGSGMTLTIHFCPNCGSVIYKEGTSPAFKGLLIM